MKDRLFFKDVPNHCYQRTIDHGVLFYTVRDHLVFFTIFCTMARRHKVEVYKLVQMPDHIHHTTVAKKREQLCAFARDYAALFAREFNRSFGREGPLFEETFKSAPKIGDKKIRTNLLYLDNNPVERKLVKHAAEFQWNYLAYAESKHPFSEKIKLRFASMPLRRALKRVAWLHRNGQYLRYEMLQRLFRSLPNDRERDQLTDYIVNTYSVIRHDKSTRFFDGYQQELLAAQSNTGSEYDIAENFIGKSDAYYGLFTAILHKNGGLVDIHDLFTASDEQKRQWMELLRRETDAPTKQIAAFLHLPVEINI